MLRKNILRGVFILGFSLFTVFLPQSAFATDVSGAITTSTTWTISGSPYVVKGNITISNNATLTIEAGVQVQFDGTYSIQVGSGTAGALIAAGSAASPVSFGKTATFTGKWNYIRFTNLAAASSLLNYCTFTNGGNSTATIDCSSASPSISNVSINGSSTDGVQLTSSSASLSNLTINGFGATTGRGIDFSNSSGAVLSGTNSISGGAYGIYLTTSSPSLSGLTVSGVIQYAVYASDAASEPTFSNVSLAGAGVNVARGGPDFWANLLAANPTIVGGPYEQQILAGTLSMGSTWGNTSGLAPIRLEGTLTIAGTTTPVLTLAPGATLKLNASVGITVGQSASLKGDLVAVGTDQSPVTITANNTAQKWATITFSANSTSVSKLDFCELSYGGSSTATVSCSSSSPALSNLTISNSGSDGIQLTSSSASLSNLTITGFGATTGHGIDFSNSSGASLSGNNVISAGGYGVYLASSSSPSISGLSVSGVSQYAVYASDVASAPTFANVSLTGAGINVARGGPDFWAGLLGANPTIIGGPYEQQVLGGTLSKTSTWGSVAGFDTILLEGMLTIAGATTPVLTLAPGAALQLNASVGITVGSVSLGGDLVGAGTALNPVTITADDTAQKWNSITFSANSTAVSMLDHCNLNYGGSSTATIYCLGSSPTLSNLTISNSASNGVQLISSTATLSNLTITASAANGIDLNSSSASISNVTINGFGATNGRGIDFSNSSDAVLSGTNTISGGAYGIYLLSSSPSFADFSFSNISKYAFFSASGGSSPTFSGTIVIGSAVSNVAIAGPNFWANFLSSNLAISGGPYKQEVIAGTLDRSSLWGGTPAFQPIHIQGAVAIVAPATKDIVLTIAAGAELRFDITGEFSVNEGGYGRASLLAQGTENSKVLFLPSAANSWAGIEIHDNLLHQPPPMARLDHCIFEGNSAGTSEFVTVHSQDVLLQVLNSEFRETGGTAIQLNSGNASLVENYIHDVDLGIKGSVGGSMAIEGCTFSAITKAVVSSGTSQIRSSTFQGVDQGVVLDSALNSSAIVDACSFLNCGTTGVDAVSGSFPVIMNSQFSGGGSLLTIPAESVDIFCDPNFSNSLSPTGDAEFLVRGGNVYQPSLWRPMGGVPFRLLGGLSFLGASYWEIEPGAIIQIENQSITGRVLAHGTIPSPILFTSAKPVPSPGDWAGLLLAPNSFIEYVTLEYASSSLGLRLGANSVLRNSTIRNNESYGLMVSSAGGVIVQDCMITQNGGDGVVLPIGSQAVFRRVDSFDNGGWGYNISAGSIEIRESNITGNALGGLLSSSTPDAAFNYWGDASGPSGAGPGSGASISGTGVAFDPWFATAIAAPFHLSSNSLSPTAFPPGTGSSTFHAVPTQPSSWKIKIFNSAGMKVVDYSGSSSVIDWTWKGAEWFGVQTATGSGGSTGGGSGGGVSVGSTVSVGGVQGPLSPIPRDPPLPDGIYDLEIVATDAAQPSLESKIQGTIELDSSLLVAKINNPKTFDYVVAGESLTVKGKASGTQFSLYSLHYGLGAEPSAWTQISTSISPVNGGALGPSLTVPSSANPDLTFRLMVTSSVNPLANATEYVVVRLFSLSGLEAFPVAITPNGDGFSDTTTIQGAASWSAQWTVEIFQGSTGPLWSLQGTGTQIQAVWGGKDSQGQTLPVGAYSAKVTATLLEDNSKVVTQSIPVSIASGGELVQILTPPDGSMVSGENVSVQVLPNAPSIPPGTTYTLHLEYGNDPEWNLLGAWSNYSGLATASWNTQKLLNGAYQLRATLFVSGQPDFSDIHTVTVRNLLLTVDKHSFDPQNAEGVQIDVMDGQFGEGSLLVEAYPADTAYTFTWGGYYSGLALPTPAWTGSASFASGFGSVFWNGYDVSGAPVPSGEYVFRAVVTYAGGQSGSYSDPVNNSLPIPIFEVVSNFSVGQQQGNTFDPYFGESTDIRFHLSFPAWMTLANASSGAPGIGIVPKRVYSQGDGHYWWDGRNFGTQGLAFPNGAPGTPILFQAHVMPNSLVWLTNKSLSVDNAAVSPISIYPYYGQPATISYNLSKPARVSLRLYDVTSSLSNLPTYAAPLYRTLLSGVLQSAGPQSIVWDGTDATGNFPVSDGNYTVEIVAEDPNYPSYSTTVRRSIRVLQ